MQMKRQIKVCQNQKPIAQWRRKKKTENLGWRNIAHSLSLFSQFPTKESTLTSQKEDSAIFNIYLTLQHTTI